MSTINRFEGKYLFLSNFANIPVVYEGLNYRNSEAAFQAQKTLDEEVKKNFVCMSPSEAKKAGKKLKLRDDWEQVKDMIMYRIVRMKFLTNEEWQQALINTFPSHLVEGNSWGDTYWGVCNGVGENKLGKILETVRAEVMDDDALKPSFLYDRLEEAYLEHNRLIIAYDLDDTVRPYKSLCCEKVKKLIRRAKETLNPYFIVFTANPHHEENVKFLTEENLPFDTINENIPTIGRYGSGLKIYYNLFLDDKAGLAEAYNALDELCWKVKNGYVVKPEVRK